MIVLENYLIFIWGFQLAMVKPNIQTNFFHSLRPLLDFFIQVIIFCNMSYVLSKPTFRNPTHTLFGHFKHIDMPCWKHVQNMNLAMESQMPLVHMSSQKSKLL